MVWFYLALLAPLLYAVVNLLDDNLLSFVYKSPYVSCVSAGLYGALPLLSRFFINAPPIPPALAALSLASGFLTLTYYFFYFKSLQSEVPSVVVALFSLAPVTVPFLAHFIVHEDLMPLQVAGFAIVLAASLTLAAADIRKLRFSPALGFVLVAVAIMDIVSVSTKYVYDRVDFYPAYLYFSAGMGLAGLCFLFLKWRDNKVIIKGIARKIKRLLPLFIFAELMGLAAEFTLNMAISQGPVSLVKVIEGIQPMFVLIIAFALYPFAPKYFREASQGQLTRKVGLMVVAVVGLALVSFTAHN